jgi:hypothetical protein
MMNGDHDFPLCMSFFAIMEGFRYVAQGVPPVDDRYYLSRFSKILQKMQTPGVDLGNKEAHLLIANPRQKWAQTQRLEHSSRTTADQDKDSLPPERAPVIEDRMVRVGAENQIVTQVTSREIFLRVIDHVIGADHPRPVYIPRAAHGSHFSAE